MGESIQKCCTYREKADRGDKSINSARGLRTEKKSRTDSIMQSEDINTQMLSSGREETTTVQKYE